VRRRPYCRRAVLVQRRGKQRFVIIRTQDAAADQQQGLQGGLVGGGEGVGDAAR